MTGRNVTTATTSDEFQAYDGGLPWINSLQILMRFGWYIEALKTG